MLSPFAPLPDDLIYGREYRKGDTKLQHGAGKRAFVASAARLSSQAAGIAQGLFAPSRLQSAFHPTKQKSCQTRLGSFQRLQDC
jgi:hypothetical protein